MHQQAKYRKQLSQSRLLESWPANWREYFPSLKFPDDGMESEKFLQELSTLARLQPDPTQVSALLEEALGKE